MAFTKDEWEAGVDWPRYLAGVKEHASLWRHHFESAEVDGISRRRLNALPGPRKVLVLTEDWCGDAARSVPVIARALVGTPGVEVRFIDIAGHPELIDRHLTKGGRAIPVAIVADGEGREIGWWGPRPAPLQTLLRARILELGPPREEDRGAFYAPLMAWYHRDRGRTTLSELLLLLERSGTL
jgi:hypothetical protein